MHDYLTVMFSHPAMEAITMWGFWQGTHWRPDAALYRSNWSEKPSLLAYQDLVFNDWWTDVMGSADELGEFLVRAFKGEYEITVEYDGDQYVVPIVLNDDMSIDVTLPFAIGPPGDFNEDGRVDAADYAVFRKFQGTQTALPNDGGLGGTVGSAHYDLWRANFGNSAAGGSLAAVPEPASCLLLLGSLMALPLVRRCRE
jgi:hypothetical protein